MRIPFLHLACALLCGCTVQTSTYTLDEGALRVGEDRGGNAGDGRMTWIEGLPGAVTPASGRFEVHRLDVDAPTRTSPVAPDGTFQLSFDDEGGERLRILVTGSGAQPSEPIDAVAEAGRLTPLPRTDCIEVPRVLPVETTRIPLRNACAFGITLGPASLRLASEAVVPEGALELVPGEASELVVTGLTGPNTLRIPVTAPTEELHAVTFVAPAP